MLGIQLRSLLLLSLILLVAVPGVLWASSGESSLPVSQVQGRYGLASVVDFAQDQAGNADIDTVMALGDAFGFRRNMAETLAFGYVDAVYWIRIRLQSTDRDNTRWLLELSGLGRAIDEIDAWLPGVSGQLEHFRAGDAVPFQARRIRHHAILFPIHLQPLQPAELYLRVKTNGTLQIPLTLWTTEHYVESEHHDSLLEGLFYGVLLIMIFYNAFIYLSVRDNSYLIYVLYLVCVLMFAVSLKGVGFEYLWPDQPWWNNKSNLVFAELGVLCVLLFARSFLQTPVNTPNINYVIATLILASIASFPFVVLASHRIAAGILSIQYLLTVFFVVVAASICLKRGFKAARYYLLAWLGVLLSILIWVLNSFNWIHSYWVGAYVFQLGTSIQVLLFSFALADRINLMRVERESALKLQLAHSKRLMSMAQMFEKFVPKQFLRRIAREGIENIQLGKAEADEISVLFADIRGFTTLSESLSPQELLNFLNACFTRLDKVIHEHDGFIDKFMGDGVMALFEQSPGTCAARNAVMAAIDMQKAVAVYNEHRARSGYAPIDIGIGINTGSVIIGTVGSSERMDSTVLGDNVNVAARLQELTKSFGARIIISEQTRAALQDEPGLHLRELGSVPVRGRRNAVLLYEVMNADAAELLAQKCNTMPLYQAALACHRKGDWQGAVQGWRECLMSAPLDSVCQHWLLEAERNLVATVTSR